MEIDIISGFFGAGKTTFLNKYLPCLEGNIVLIENEFGDVGLDANLINENIKIKELNSGCICCTMQMDFRDAIKEIYNNFSVERIVIEPSGIGKLSYITSVCEKVKELDNININIGKKIVIVDASAFMDSLEDFGAFYLDQISNANIIFLNRIEDLVGNTLNEIIEEIRKINQQAKIYNEDFRKMSNQELMAIIDSATIMNKNNSLLDYDGLANNYNELESIALCTNKIFTKKELFEIENNIKNNKFGNIIRAKGILNSNEANKKWHFDYTLSTYNVELLNNQELVDNETKIIFIGKNLKNNEIEKLK